MTQEDYRKLSAAEWLDEREKHMDKHSAWVADGVVKMSNNDDGYYTEVFKTREEVERFVAYLLLKADEAWPN
jgi:hypothetical protein